MNDDNFMVGIGCCGTVGKDTLFNILDKLFPDQLERVALADLLKSEVNDFCEKQYGISAFTKIPEEKELVRLLFVAHGKIKRLKYQGKYWTGLVQDRINEIFNNNLIPVCTDIRYSVYPEDELYWLKTKNNGVYIHVNRYNKDGSKFKALNSEEEEQEKILEKQADFRLNWQTSNDEEYLIDTVKLQLFPLLERINLKYGTQK